MHFDEVYHARTATEFLQDWRYGLSHDIYEWTHPHLAKYAMAVGIVLWGEDDVSATSDLGVPVTASVVEPAPRGRGDAGQRAGERLHVATGTEIRTYDLRDPRARLGRPGRRRRPRSRSTIDRHRLVIGYNDGRVATLDLATMGDRRHRRGPRADRRRPGRSPDHPPARHRQRHGGHRRIERPRDGHGPQGRRPFDGTQDLAGIAACRRAGPASLSWPTSTPSRTCRAPPPSWPTSSPASRPTTRRSSRPLRPARRSSSAARGRATRARHSTRRSPTGRCPAFGSRTSSASRSLTRRGVTFLDPTRTSVISTVAMNGGAHGLALVTGVDDPKLYVTSGGADGPGLRHRRRRWRCGQGRPRRRGQASPAGSRDVGGL